jgi:hypothetical protein
LDWNSIVPQGHNQSREITFRRNDEWVLEYLLEIVAAKKESGIRTSLSYEIVRLVKNALCNEVNGGELDALILKERMDDLAERLDPDIRGLVKGPSRMGGDLDDKE